MLNTTSQGFLPDVNRIMYKYGLEKYFREYFEEGLFPGKYAWKRVAKTAIKKTYVLNWNLRTSIDQFQRYRFVHCTFQVCNFCSRLSKF